MISLTYNIDQHLTTTPVMYLHFIITPIDNLDHFKSFRYIYVPEKLHEYDIKNQIKVQQRCTKKKKFKTQKELHMI
jgi:hypothetical protein